MHLTGKSNHDLKCLPGAAHMSKMTSPGWGFKTCPTTTEGKFWRNSTWGRMPFRDGHLYNGNVIWIATPLQKKMQSMKTKIIEIIMCFSNICVRKMILICSLLKLEQNRYCHSCFSPQLSLSIYFLFGWIFQPISDSWKWKTKMKDIKLHYQACWSHKYIYREYMYLFHWIAMDIFIPVTILRSNLLF